MSISKGRWGGLRSEPYDPFAHDADGDGIVQEGTAFERPANTRIVDQLGRDLVEGHTSGTYIPGIRYVDKNGKIVEYAIAGQTLSPTGKAPSSSLGKLGHGSLADRGHLTILQIQKQARARGEDATNRASPAALAGASVPPKTKDALSALSDGSVIEYKAISTPRRPLRLEPYDPDAVDGDGDGIVQDGTAWERPIGTRIITNLGREVARGMQTRRPNRENRIVDRDGNDVDYTPKRAKPLRGLARIRAARRPQPRAGTVKRKQSAASLPPVPDEPGTKPIPAGWVRLYHYTGGRSGDTAIEDVLDSIRSNGLQLSRSRGAAEFAEGDYVWASAKFPERAAYIVEFAVAPDDPRIGIGGFATNVGFNADIRPDEILAIHEPWHDHYRYMIENDMTEAVLRGEWDGLADMPDYGEAIARIKDEYGIAESLMTPPTLPPSKKGPSSPMGQLGHPTLAERGHATLDDYLTPPEIPAPEPAPSPPATPSLPEKPDGQPKLPSKIAPDGVLYRAINDEADATRYADPQNDGVVFFTGDRLQAQKYGTRVFVTRSYPRSPINTANSEDRAAIANAVRQYLSAINVDDWEDPASRSRIILQMRELERALALEDSTATTSRVVANLSVLHNMISTPDDPFRPGTGERIVMDALQRDGYVNEIEDGIYEVAFPALPQDAIDPTNQSSVNNHLIEQQRKSLGGLPDLPPSTDWPPRLPYDVATGVSNTGDDDWHVDARTSLTQMLWDFAYNLGTILDDDLELFADSRSNKREIEGIILELLGHDDAESWVDDMLTTLESELDQLHKQIRDNGRVQINMPPFALLGLMKDGRYKSQFETKTSRGALNFAVRTDFEQEHLSVPRDIAPALRPVYGTLDVEGLPNDGRYTFAYGPIVITLKESVRNRTTFTIGDSLAGVALPLPLGQDVRGGLYAAMTRLPREKLMSTLVQRALEDLFDGSSLSDLQEAFAEMGFDEADVLALLDSVPVAFDRALAGYRRQVGESGLGGPKGHPWADIFVEAQIHGGVSLFDIESIRFPAQNGSWLTFESESIEPDEYSKIVKALQAMGINVTIGDLSSSEVTPSTIAESVSPARIRPAPSDRTDLPGYREIG